jgi:polysaccharide export outer membrane protein
MAELTVPDDDSARNGGRRCGGLVLIGLALALTGCTVLPSSGPTGPELEDALADHNPLGVKLVEIVPAVVETLQAAAVEDSRDGPAPITAPPDVDRIGPGDELTVSIFEIGAGLFQGRPAGPAEADSAATTIPQSLPKLIVDGDGWIFVPYAGRIRAAGLNAAQLQASIEAKLKDQALNPQVIVTVATNISNTIVVSGDVKSPGRQKLTLARETLLDSIALAGGTTHLAADMVIKLQGPHHQEAMPLALIELNGRQNVVLEPGDRVQLDFLPRTISVFGAGGRVAQLPFDAPHLTLAEALARTGGPSDYQADATAVYLFRYESPTASRLLGLSATATAAPVAYHINLLDPTSYFLMERFAMHDQDLIFIANARTNKLQKIMSIVSGAFTPLIVGKQLSQ